MVRSIKQKRHKDSYYVKHRWKKVGFSSSRKYQEFLKLFKEPFCARCGMSRELHNLAFNFDITIHHIDFNKFNNSPENLETLCALCHIAVDPSFQEHWIKCILARKRKKRRKSRK